MKKEVVALKIVVYAEDEMLKKRIRDYIEKHRVHDLLAVNDHTLGTVGKTNADVLIISADLITPVLMEEMQSSFKGLPLYLAGNSTDDAVTAYKYRFDGFIFSGRLEADLEWSINNAAFLSKRRTSIYAVTFGDFSLYKNERLVDFRNCKAKELAALCIDKRGQAVDIEEAVDKLWGGRAYDKRVKGLYRKAVMDIRNTFKKYGIEGIFESGRGYCRLDASAIKCDYYSFMDEPEKFYYLFGGEYMHEYSWGEATLARLYDIYTSKKKNDFL